MREGGRKVYGQLQTVGATSIVHLQSLKLQLQEFIFLNLLSWEMRKHPYFLGICFPCCSVLMKIASQILLNILTKVILLKISLRKRAKFVPNSFLDTSFVYFL